MSNNTRKPLTERKMKVYEIIFNMIVKAVLIGVGIFAFFIILNKILETETDKMLIVYGSLEALLAGTLFLVYRHYFPSK